MRLLIDTNVAVDYLHEREGFFCSAKKLMVLGFLHEFELWMSSSQVTDLFFILSDGGRASLVEGVKRDIRNLRQFVRICPLDEAGVDAALESTWRDFEDACVYQAARKIKADAIITRNQRDFDKSSIKVFDCDQLFEYLKEEKGLTYEEIPW